MNAKHFQTLVAPHFSEKSSRAAMFNQYVFKAKPTASKKDIKAAVEALFNVVVEDVSVLNVKGKTKRHGRTMGRRSDWKKVYVKLQAGHTIDVSGASA